MMHRRMTRLLAVVLIACATGPAWATDDAVVAIEVGSAIGVEGGGAGYLVIENGRITALSAKGAPSGARVLSFKDGVACPGLIDPLTNLGSGAIEEPGRAMTPELDAADALWARHSSFETAAQGGITTVGLSPSSSNLIGGSIAIVHTSNGDGKAVLGGGGPLRMTLGGASLRRDRYPTSRMGAMHILRKAVADGLPGSGSIVIAANSPDEIRLVQSLLGETGRAVSVYGASGGQDALRHVEGTSTAFVLNAVGVGSNRRDLLRPGQLADAGHAVAFTAGGNPAGLRLSAALAAREGMDADAALAAITSAPATVLGISDHAGSLAVGKRGDVVIFDGHPLDLSSRILAVIVGGQVVDLGDDEDDD